MKRILCFGDSNTWGHDPVDCSRLVRRWPVFLRERMAGYDIVDDGVCGRTTVHGAADEEGHNGIMSFRERYIEKEEKFDLIVIMLGTNDYLIENSSSPAQVADALALYVREIRARYGQEQRMLIVSPILIRREAMSHPIFSELYGKSAIDNSEKTAREISRMADSEGVYFMNAAEFARASEIDGVHMDEKEHEKLARAIEKKIREIV